MRITPKGAPVPAKLPTATARDRALSVAMGQSSPPPADSIPAGGPMVASSVPSPIVDAVAESAESSIKTESLESSEGQSPIVEETKSSDKGAGEESDTSDESLSKQYAILARKEKALRANIQKLNAERDAFKAEQSALVTKSSQPSFDPSKYISLEDLQKDTFGTLSKYGMSYDKIANEALNQPSLEERQMRQYQEQMELKMRKLEEQQTEMQKKSEESQKRQYDQAITQIKSDVRRLVSNDEAFETIKSTNSVDDVVQLIEDTFNNEGTLLSVEEAAKAVEEYLVEEALKLAKLKKIQAKLAPANPAPKATDASKPAIKTLTNAVTSSQPLTTRQRALLAFEGKLK